MSLPINLNNVAIYLRKSRQDVIVETGDEDDTLSKHKRALWQLAKKHHYQIKAVYEEVVSGESILDRPQMQALLGAVQEQRYDAVLCMDIDRLGRGNMIDQGLIQNAFKRSGTMIITPGKVYDLRDELDEEWSEFKTFMARRELKTITRRLQRGRQQSAAEGKSISSKPPYGYQRGSDLKLYPDPQTAHIVRLIFHLAASGLGSGAIATYLTAHGYRTPGNKDQWSRSSVYFILHNPAYFGHIVWGRVRYRKVPGRLGYVKDYPQPQEWIRHEHSHEPLIDVKIYVHYLQYQQKITKITTKRTLSNPLATLLYCSQCQHAMRYQKVHHGRYHRLVCTTRECPTKGADFEIVEQKILATLRQLLTTAPMTVDILDEYNLDLPAKAKNDLLKKTIERIDYRRDPEWIDLDQFEITIHLRPL